MSSSNSKTSSSGRTLRSTQHYSPSAYTRPKRQRLQLSPSVAVSGNGLQQAVRQLAYSASPETTAASSSGALRCPYSGCPYNSVSFVGWEKAAWMSHINSIHIAGERQPLPATCSPSVLTCEGCGLIISSRGCQTCKGKPGIAVCARMDSPVLTSQVLPVVRIDESLSPSPLEVLQWPCRVMRHVPKCARLLWCQNLTSAIHNFVSTPSTVSLAKLFMLHKVLLAESVRGGKRAKRAHGCHIIQMMQRWADGELQYNWG